MSWSWDLKLLSHWSKSLGNHESVSKHAKTVILLHVLHLHDEYTRSLIVLPVFVGHNLSFFYNNGYDKLNLGDYLDTYHKHWSAAAISYKLLLVAGVWGIADT